LSDFRQFLASVFRGAPLAFFKEMLFPVLHNGICGELGRLRQYQALTAVCVQIAAVLIAALAAKSSASLACHVRAASVTARCAAILSSTARRR
jgi:hypothetical protein